MRSIKYSLIISALLCFILAIVAFVLWKGDKSEENLVLDEYIIDVGKDSITKIDISNETEDYAIDWLNGNVKVASIDDSLLLPEYTEILRDKLSRLKGEKIENVKYGDETSKKYGFSDNSPKAIIKYSSGAIETLTIGAYEAISDSYYINIDKNDLIYLVDKKSIARLLMPSSEYVNYIVTYPERTSAIADLKYIKLKGEAFKQETTIENINGNEKYKKLAQSFGAVTHVITNPFIVEANLTELTNLTDSLFGMISEEVILYNATDKELKNYHFDKPFIEIEYKYDSSISPDEVNETIKIAKMNDGYYALVSGRDVIYKIADLAFINTSLEKLESKWFLTPVLLDIEEVKVIYGDNTFDFDVSTDKEEKYKVFLEEKEIKKEEFSKYYNLLVSVTREDEMQMVKGNEDFGEKQISIVYSYNDKSKKDDVIDIYEGQGRMMTLVMNNKVYANVRKTFVENVKEATEALIKGNIFSIYWK